jgi:hypothetical protein
MGRENKRNRIFFLRYDWLPFMCLLGLSFLVGIVTFRDYGMSMDESAMIALGKKSLSAYLTLQPLTQEAIPSSPILVYYGPLFAMGTAAVTEVLLYLFPDFIRSDLWHLCYFLGFLLAVCCLYLLAWRWFSPSVAFGVALLFSSQPLLWGHAFINPKDIPFLAFFLLSLVSGLWCCDRLFGTAYTRFTRNHWQNQIEQLRVRWKELSRSSQDTSGKIDGLKEVTEQIKALIFTLRQPVFWVSAIALGLSTSIRVVAPMVGLIIVILALGRGGKKAIGPLCGYFLIAALVTYGSWPALWANPIEHYLKSWQMAFQFPWQGKIFFMGEFWRAWELPWFYLPLLFAIQFTEPLVILASSGLILLIVRIKHFRSPELPLLILLWFILPVGVLIFKRPPLYDNFRQVLFLVPPLFLLAGVALEEIYARLRSPLIRFVFYLVLFFPGVYGYLQLHPYEYTYYNSFVGGVKGASRAFETEYWMTSFREAIEYINQIAPPSKRVLVWEGARLVANFIRPDLILVENRGNTEKSNLDNDYLIISSRYHKDEKIFKAAPILYQVERQGVPFTVVKAIGESP